MVKRGNKLEYEIARSLRNREPRIWWRKLVNVRWKTAPFDFLVISSHCYAIECKMTRLNSFPFTNLNEGQERALNYLERISLSTHAYVLINYRNRDKRLNRAFAISYPQYCFLKEHMKNYFKQNSLPYSILDKQTKASNGVSELSRTRYPTGNGWLLPFIT